MINKIKYEKLAVGLEFPPSYFSVDFNTLSAYLKATEDSSELYDEGIVPPMAIAALAMKALMGQFEILPGTVHTSQQLTFLNIARVGEKLISIAKVTRKIARGKFHMFSISINVQKENGEIVITGELGFVLPLLQEK